MAVTPDQESEFVAIINAAVAKVDLTTEEAARLLLGCAEQAAAVAWGPQEAAQQVYMLSLQLAKRAGLGDLPSTARH